MNHRSWFVPHKNRTVDTKGVTIALLFLVLMMSYAGFRADREAEIMTWQVEPPLSARLDVRRTTNLSFEERIAASVSRCENVGWMEKTGAVLCNLKHGVEGPSHAQY
jgi:hypothetical protein